MHRARMGVTKRENNVQKLKMRGFIVVVVIFVLVQVRVSWQQIGNNNSK